MRTPYVRTQLREEFKQLQLYIYWPLFSVFQHSSRRNVFLNGRGSFGAQIQLGGKNCPLVEKNIDFSDFIILTSAWFHRDGSHKLQYLHNAQHTTIEGKVV